MIIVKDIRGSEIPVIMKNQKQYAKIVVNVVIAEIRNTNQHGKTKVYNTYPYGDVSCKAFGCGCSWNLEHSQYQERFATLWSNLNLTHHHAF